MATLILLNKTELPKGTPSEALVAVWDKGSVPDGQISIPVELNERLLPIRDDLAAWTYETGCARINGKLLEELLRGEAGVRGVLGFPQQCLVLSKNAQGHLGAANIHARIDLHVPRRPFCCGFYP